jgi:hypothetical protein
MDTGLSALFSWQFLLFALGIAVLVWFVRTILEYYSPSILSKKFYNDLVLPLSPTVLGGVVALFATKYAYPDGLSSTIGRFFFGVVAGTLSSTVYRVVKAMAKQKIDQAENPNFVPPPPPSNTTVVISAPTPAPDQTQITDK